MGGWGSCLHSRSFDGCVGGIRVFVPGALMGGWVKGSYFHSRSFDGCVGGVRVFIPGALTGGWMGGDQVFISEL